MSATIRTVLAGVAAFFEHAEAVVHRSFQERLRNTFDSTRMASGLIVRPRAEADLEEAAQWYEDERAAPHRDLRLADSITDRDSI